MQALRRAGGRNGNADQLVLSANRTLRAELDLPNPDGVLRPGMYAMANIVLEECPDACVVPCPR